MIPGPLIVVSGPSGSGKSTLIQRALEEFGPRLHHSVSSTTRGRRPGELDGVNYHFVTREEFDDGIARGDYLEFATVFGKYYYGTPRSEVDPYRLRGLGVVLDIDVQGAEQIRRACPDAYSIFLDTPPGACEARLRARGTESEESIQSRLETARAEVARAREFDYRLLNDELVRAARELCAVIEKLFLSQNKGG